MSLDLHCVVDFQNRFLDLNPAWERSLGWAASELLNKTFMEILHPEDIENALKEAKRLENGGTSFNFQCRMRHKNGSYQVFRWNGISIPERQIMIATGRDVTELHQSEIERTCLNEAIYHSSIVGITDPKGRIVEVNDNFCRISQYSREELLGRDHRILNSGFHTKEFFTEMWKTISSGKIWTGQIQNQAKDGSHYWVQTVISPLKDISGKIVKYVAVRFEITAQKDAETRMLQSSKLAALGEMVGGVGHEINNPLAVLQGKASRVLKELNREKIDVEKCKEDLLKIQHMGERISKIVKSLKSLTRNAEADPMKATKLDQIVETCMEVSKERFRSHNVDLRLINEHKEEWVECRESEIAQVITNLLSNAFDAVELLTERWVELRVEKRFDEVVFTVTDSGTGIPDEIIAKMMLPFYTTKVQGKGTGLGLSISTQIIRNHHGRLSYDKSCKNTRFVLQLPLIQPVQVKRAA